MTKISLVMVLALIGLITVNATFASSDRDCNLKQICAQPGDFLKYSAQVYGRNGTITYNFGNFIGPNTLNVSVSTIAMGQTVNAHSVLNLKNTTLTNSDGSKGAFFFMVLTPINANEVAASPFKESTAMYNNYQRSTFAIDESNGTDSQVVTIDKETGVLLNFKVEHLQVVSGQPIPTGTSFELVDTNIITSSDLQSTSESQPIISSITNNTSSGTSPVSNVPNSVSNVPNSVSNVPSSTSSNDPTIIYIGIAIAIAGAGVGIFIVQKRKQKKA